VPAHFQPAALPLIVVPDRDTALKKRLDEDADDRKISLSALRLARKFTASIDSSHDHRLYVNLDNPAVVRLLQAVRADEPNAAIAARLLKAFKNILDGQGAHAPSTLNRALLDLAASVERLIDASPPSPSPSQEKDPAP
jgi:molecular chaperone HtpG